MCDNAIPRSNSATWYSPHHETTQLPPTGANAFRGAIYLLQEFRDELTQDRRIDCFLRAQKNRHDGRFLWPVVLGFLSKTL